MTKPLLTAAAFGLSLSTAAIAQTAGMVELPVSAPHHPAPLIGALWYPAYEATPNDIYAQNPVFQGVPVARDAPIAPGAHPLVLLSHGMGGGVQSVAWIGNALAERGAIVVAVSHPGSTFSDFDMSRGVRHWTRAQDLSTALDTVLATEAFAGSVDMTNIMAAGFSYGGWTALSLGGATSDLAGFAETCAQADTQACRIFLDPAHGVQDIAAADWQAGYSDARVSAVFALDPGFVWGLSPANLSGLLDSVTLVGLGNAQQRMWDTNFDASGLSAMLPEADMIQIAPAVHFSGMPLCTSAGAAILQDEGDDPVCTDPEGADRAAIHARIIDAMAAQIGLE